MNNILAAEVLRGELELIKDNSVKIATEIAIESLYMDAIDDWHKSNTNLSAIEYLRLNDKQYERWVLGKTDSK